MRKFTIILLTAICAITTAAYAQNYDEAKVGNYPLPDPLTFTDGKKVKNKKLCVSAVNLHAPQNSI